MNKPYKIGFDVDGVLANFTVGYAAKIIEVIGRDLFQPDDITDPKSWDWDLDAGYTKAETKETWRRIMAAPQFWLELPALAGMTELVNEFWNSPLGERAQIYFITARAGEPKRITEMWLSNNGILNPTVLMTPHKGLTARALELDAYIDDKLENALDVAVDAVWDVPKTGEVRSTRSYLLNRRHNAHVSSGYIRVASVQEMFTLEREKYAAY